LLSLTETKVWEAKERESWLGKGQNLGMALMTASEIRCNELLGNSALIENQEYLGNAKAPMIKTKT